MRVALVPTHTPRVSTLRHFGLALALLAAAVTALCAAHARLGQDVVAWRALVSFASVWAFQFSVAEMWKISEPVPQTGADSMAQPLMERSPGSE